MKFLVNYAKITPDNELIENDEVQTTLSFYKMFEVQVKSGVKYGYTLIDWNNNATYNGSPIAAILVISSPKGYLFEIITEA